MGPDLFGLLRLPDPPPFLRHIDLRTLLPEHIAPLLRRISLTRPVPQPEDLQPAALAADPGPVTTTTRTPATRRWAQPPGTPLLPAQITIPHLIHGIWLGTPLNPASNYAANFAAAARHHAGHADYTLWTDIPRHHFTAADTTPPPPDGHPDPHAPHRAMLTWARDNHIHLVNVHEIFHAAQPMTLHAQYTAETNKQLPRGYAGASDHLRLDIIHLLGGIYTDGDNHLTPHATPADLTTLLHDATASDHGFTLHLLPAGMNNDLIIAPARHPAIRLWQELARYRYYLTQAELFGGLDRMAQRYSDHQKSLLRYCVVHRSGRVHHQLIALLDIAVDDERLVRVNDVFTHGSDLSWSTPSTPPPLGAADRRAGHQPPHPRHHHPRPPAHQPRRQPPPHRHRPPHHHPPRPRRRLDRHPHPPRRPHHHRRHTPRHLHHPPSAGPTTAPPTPSPCPPKPTPSSTAPPTTTPGSATPSPPPATPPGSSTKPSPPPACTPAPNPPPSPPSAPSPRPS